jgi:hypothetical protein
MRKLAFGLALGSMAFVLTTKEAEADRSLRCDMNGVWVEDRDNFNFVANYVAKDGPDVFQGVYVNSSAGATANVRGTASSGTWTVSMTYTDAKHRGYVKTLIGQGQRVTRNQLTIRGSFTAKKDGRDVQRGTFTLNGQCK